MLSYLHGDMISDIHKGTFISYYNGEGNELTLMKTRLTRIFNYTNVHQIRHREGFTEVSADKIEIRKFDRAKLQTNVRRDTFTEEEWERL